MSDPRFPSNDKTPVAYPGASTSPFATIRGPQLSKGITEQSRKVSCNDSGLSVAKRNPQDFENNDTLAAPFKLTRAIHNRAFGALLGLAMGDALGVPLEFCERDAEPQVRDLIGGGPFDLLPGQWTDDTSMALCLADCLIANRGLDEGDLLDRFVRWWQAGENSVTGYCFDIGITTRFSLEYYQRHGVSAGTGPRSANSAGNGSLMRLAPTAIFAVHDPDLARRLAGAQSETTHANDEARSACEFFATLLVEAMNGVPKHQLLAPRHWTGTTNVNEIAAGAWKRKNRRQIQSSGFVIHTLEAALWSVNQSESFEESLTLAVNLGEDSDTVGAVTGQLAGAIYGQSAIPSRWLEKLAWKDVIENRVVALLRAANAGQNVLR